MELTRYHGVQYRRCDRAAEKINVPKGTASCCTVQYIKGCESIHTAGLLVMQTSALRSLHILSVVVRRHLRVMMMISAGSLHIRVDPSPDLQEVLLVDRTNITHSWDLGFRLIHCKGLLVGRLIGAVLRVDLPEA